jgi:hypothetical protein
MSTPATYDAFESRLRTGFTAINLVFENEFAQQLLETKLPFVYVEIFGDSYDQETMGAPQQNMFLERGMTYLHVMTASGQGSRQARVYANDLLNLFREQPLSSADGTIYMTEFSIGMGEPGVDFPNYFATTASITWYRRDITDLT